MKSLSTHITESFVNEGKKTKEEIEEMRENLVAKIKSGLLKFYKEASIGSISVFPLEIKIFLNEKPNNYRVVGTMKEIRDGFEVLLVERVKSTSRNKLLIAKKYETKFDEVMKPLLDDYAQLNMTKYQ